MTSSPTFSKARVNSGKEVKDNSVDSVEHNESKQNDSPSPSPLSSSSSSSNPKGQLLGTDDCFWCAGRSNRESASDSAELASWDGIGWLVSWKNPS